MILYQFGCRDLQADEILYFLSSLLISEESRNNLNAVIKSKENKIKEILEMN